MLSFHHLIGLKLKRIQRILMMTSIKYGLRVLHRGGWDLPFLAMTLLLLGLDTVAAGFDVENIFRYLGD